MSKNLPIIAIIVALAIGGGLWYFSSPKTEGESTANVSTTEAETKIKANCPDFSKDTLKVDEHEFQVGIARSEEEREVGLGGCPALDDDQGLYFVFEETKVTAFWMKGMLMPIDIIWVADGEVVGIEHEVPAPESPKDTDIPQYQSPQAVDSVLEIASGEAKKRDIKVGSKISL